MDDDPNWQISLILPYIVKFLQENPENPGNPENPENTKNPEANKFEQVWTSLIKSNKSQQVWTGLDKSG